MKNSYPDLIVNAFKSVQAWKSLSFLLMGVLLVETFAIAWLANQRTVLLVPQHMNANKPVVLNLGEPFSPDYLTAVAKGDLYSLLNWTPENIDQQYGLFLGRVTQALQGEQKTLLMEEIKQHRENGLSQSFYTTRTYVKGNEVTVHGILVRATGGKEIFRGPAAFTLEYQNAGNSMLLINGVRQPNEAEQKALENEQRSAKK